MEMETVGRYYTVPPTVPGAIPSEGPHELDIGHTLTAKQYWAWSTFGPEWDDFRQAWLRRGFRLPPSGREDEPRTQRTLLSEVLWSRPGDLVIWVGEAPGRTSYEVVGFVLKRWHQAQQVAANLPPSHQPVRSGSLDWIQPRRRALDNGRPPCPTGRSDLQNRGGPMRRDYP